MNKFMRIIFFGSVLSVIAVTMAPATTLVGDATFGTNNSDSSGYIGADNISVVSGGSVIISAVTGGYISVNDTFEIDGNFLHNGLPTLVSDPTFHGTGSFSFTGDNSIVTAKTLTVGGDLINGDGASPWNLRLNVDAINIAGNFIASEDSKMTIASNFANAPSLIAGNIDIAGGLYMGASAGADDVVHILSNAGTDVYTITSNGTMDVNGDVNADLGKLVINATDATIAGDVLGNTDFDVDTLALGGASLIADPDWRQRLQHTSDGFGGYIGNLLSDGTINSNGDILVGGNVDGDLDITSAADMWVGQDLLGYWSIDVDNLYVLGNVDGGGDITADTINIGGDLSGDINIDTNQLNVGNDVLGGTKFRPNMPTGTNPYADASGPFHVNPDTGNSGPFKQIDMTVGGIYYFDDNSYLQLVLNSGTAATGGASAYESDLDDALIKVGGFDASAVSHSPNYMDMNSTPNIEILVDNMAGMIQKIKLIEVTNPSGPLVLGNLDFAGVWFYWDDNSDGINDRRLFQETRLIAENNFVYAMLATMDSIESLTRANPKSGGNDIQMGGAIDDLILSRLQKYPGYTGNALNNYYTSVMRILFPQSDTFYDLMLNGGSHYDATDVMVSQSPANALALVRGLNLDDVANIGNKLAVSGRIGRNAVTDQLLEDFIWTRYYDKNNVWLRTNFSGDISSFNLGADTKIKKIIIGANVGYNDISFAGLSGYNLNLGVYGTYDLNNFIRLYARGDFEYYSMDAEISNAFVGTTSADLSTVGTTFDIGLIHKIYDTYLTGRGYLTFGYLGGYNITQQYRGNDFMDIRADGQMILAPGYEVALGKDIWFSIESFIRPSLRFGIEYDVLSGSNNDLDFRFSGVNNWRNWDTNSGDGLWLRYGAQIDFSFIVGTNFSIGYERLQNGDLKTNQIKLNGAYRF